MISDWNILCQVLATYILRCIWLVENWTWEWNEILNYLEISWKRKFDDMKEVRVKEMLVEWFYDKFYE